VKSILRTLFVLWLIAWSATPAIAQEAGYRLEVAGLACPFCAYGIEKQLNGLEGVERVDTQLKEGAVMVIMAEGATLDEATARQAVEDAGFTLDGFAHVSEETDQ